MNGRGRGHTVRMNLFRFDEPYQIFELLETEPIPSQKPPKEPEELDPSIEEMTARLGKTFCISENTDLSLRRFRIGNRMEAMAAFLNGLADADRIGRFLLAPAQTAAIGDLAVRTPEALQQAVFPLDETALCASYSEAIAAITEGRTAVFLEG